MGLSSKKTKTKSTETIAPSDYSKPYIDTAAQTLNPAYEQSKALLAKYQPQLESGIGYYGDVQSGKYLDEQNPYLDKVLGRMNQDTADTVNSQFSGAGRYGSDYHAGVLADRIGDNEAKTRFANYNTERGYQNSAPLQQGALISSLIGAPQQAAGAYSDNISQLLSRYLTSNGQSTTKQGGSILDSLAKVAQIAATVASDRRLKMDIEKVGADTDGLGLYRYRYVTDDPEAPLREGVMADEVEKLRPWALGPERNGFKTVNYGAL